MVKVKMDGNYLNFNFDIEFIGLKSAGNCSAIFPEYNSEIVLEAMEMTLSKMMKVIIDGK